MTTFQLLLFIIAGGIFYLFLKQLFSGNHPKRGVDFEAKLTDDNIGSISNPDKFFNKPKLELSRIDELMSMAKESIENGDLEDASKALGSLLILQKDNVEALAMMGSVSLQIGDYERARESFDELLKIDSDDDMAHSLLANALHKLNLSTQAKIHHKKSIELDDKEPSHYYNYANTLYDLKEHKEALEMYKKCYELDSSLDEAKDMIASLEGEING